jgi:uncharacterized protein YjbJ (UPF0337 family)
MDAMKEAGENIKGAAKDGMDKAGNAIDNAAAKANATKDKTAADLKHKMNGN